jgi:hypothetical protein
MLTAIQAGRRELREIVSDAATLSFEISQKKQR